jgi:hypothetical protein
MENCFFILSDRLPTIFQPCRGVASHFLTVFNGSQFQPEFFRNLQHARDVLYCCGLIAPESYVLELNKFRFGAKEFASRLEIVANPR